MMKDYLAVETMTHGEVDSYLDDGWELIDTSREVTGDGGQTLLYHLGLPAKTMMMKYKKIIDAYEDNGLKEQLFKKVAENHGREYEDYSRASHGHKPKDAVANFMENYEKVVHEESVYYIHKDDDKPFEVDDNWL